jgi:uncharacterized protein
MKNLDDLKQILSAQKQSLCDRYQLTTLGIFGSYARGEQTEASDVDILVDYEIAPTFNELIVENHRFLKQQNNSSKSANRSSIQSSQY